MPVPTPLEPGNRIQLPAAWTQELGLQGLVLLEKTADGILVRPYSVASWDEIFANKLPVGRSTSDGLEDIELRGDDLLF